MTFFTITETLLQLCFPPACVRCGKLGKHYLCPQCLQILQPSPHIQTYPSHHPFHQHIYLFRYQGALRELFLSYKFHQQSHIYHAFVEILIKNEKIYRNLKNYDIIVAVPISKQRKKERGYNQSALIARKIAKQVGIRYAPHVLCKIKHNLPQHNLEKKQRKENVKNAYKLQYPQTIQGKKVLLIDDIYTTGNTVKECSRVLQQAGVKQVSVLTIAKDYIKEGMKKQWKI